MKYPRSHEANRPCYSRNSLLEAILRPLTPARNYAQTAANRAVSCSKPRRFVRNPAPERRNRRPKKQEVEQMKMFSLLARGFFGFSSIVSMKDFTAPWVVWPSFSWVGSLTRLWPAAGR